MGTDLLQYWKKYIENKTGKIEKKVSSSIYNRSEEYTISYKDNYPFIVVIYQQLEPEKGEGPYLTMYTKCYIPFKNVNVAYIGVNKKTVFKKLWEALTNRANNSFDIDFYIKSTNSDIKKKLLDNEIIKQIILELKNIYITVYKNSNSPLPDTPLYNDVLEIHINDIITDEASIKKINKLASTLLNIVTHK